MAARRKLTLSESERSELESVAYYAPKPYQRERAAALLKIADGQSPHRVARQGLLIRRDPDTVYGWLDEYERTRQAKRVVAAGRGRKPLFSP